MKILSLVLGLCLITSFAFADVTAEIIAYDKDDNGNIRIKTQYKIDGVEVISNYPQLNGKYYYVTRYSWQNFEGMTETEIKTRILEDINQHTENLVVKTYSKIANQDIIDDDLGTLIGSKIITKDATITINEKDYTLKTDGTFTVKPAVIQ